MPAEGARKPRHHRHQRGLAGAVGAEQAGHPGADGEGHVVDGDDVAEPARDRVQDHRAHRDPTLRKRATMAARPRGGDQDGDREVRRDPGAGRGREHRARRRPTPRRGRWSGTRARRARRRRRPGRRPPRTVMAWTAVTTPGTTTSATIEPTTAKPRRSDTEEMKPVMPASMAATSTSSATALRRSTVCSPTSRPASSAPAYRTSIGSSVKTSKALWQRRPAGERDDVRRQRTRQVEHDRAVAQVPGEQHRRLGGREEAHQQLRLVGVVGVGERQLGEPDDRHHADDDGGGQGGEAEQQEGQDLGPARAAQAERVPQAGDVEGAGNGRRPRHGARRSAR